MKILIYKKDGDKLEINHIGNRPQDEVMQRIANVADNHKFILFCDGFDKDLIVNVDEISLVEFKYEG